MRRSFVALALGVAALLAAGAPAAGGASPATFRVVTYNMLHGGLESGLRGHGQYLEQRLALAAAELAALAPDVLALQEASVGPLRGNLAGRLAAHLALPQWRLASSPGVLERLAAVALGFDEKPAILARFPVTAWHSAAVARCNEVLARALLCADVTTPDGPVVVCSTHVDGSPCQLAALADLLAARRRAAPLILMGDLNAPEDAPGMRVLVRRLRLVDAFRAANPDVPGPTVWQPVTVAERVARRRVDYVLLAPGGGRCLEVRASRIVLDRAHRTAVGTLWPSDHYAVLADLAFAPDPPATGCAPETPD